MMESQQARVVALLVAITLLGEIRAREAISSTPDVGQIIKDLHGLQFDGETIRTGELNWILAKYYKRGEHTFTETLA